MLYVARELAPIKLPVWRESTEKNDTVSLPISLENTRLAREGQV